VWAKITDRGVDVSSESIGDGARSIIYGMCCSSRSGWRTFGGTWHRSKERSRSTGSGRARTVRRVVSDDQVISCGAATTPGRCMPRVPAPTRRWMRRSRVSSRVVIRSWQEEPVDLVAARCTVATGGRRRFRAGERDGSWLVRSAFDYPVSWIFVWRCPSLDRGGPRRFDCRPGRRSRVEP